MKPDSTVITYAFVGDKFYYYKRNHLKLYRDTYLSKLKQQLTIQLKTYGPIIAVPDLKMWL